MSYCVTASALRPPSYFADLIEPASRAARFPRHLACQPDSAKKPKSGPKTPPAPPQEGDGARTGRQVNLAPLPGRSPVQVGASASAPARRALPLSTPGQGGS